MECSVGIHYQDTFYKIVKLGTEEKVSISKEGEICLSVLHSEEVKNSIMIIVRKT